MDRNRAGGVATRIVQAVERVERGDTLRMKKTLDGLIAAIDARAPAALEVIRAAEASLPPEGVSEPSSLKKVALSELSSLELIKAALRNPQAGFGDQQALEKRSDGINLGGVDLNDAEKRREALDLMKAALSKPTLKVW